MNEALKDYVNIEQAAALIGVHSATVKRWMNNGKMEYIQESQKKYLIPMGEVKRLQKENGRSPEKKRDGSVDFRTLHETQQLDLLAHRVEHLQYLEEKERLKKEIAKRKRELAIAEQTLRRLEEHESERQKVYHWPDKYMESVVNGIPPLAKDARYQDLVKYKVIKEADRKSE